MLWSRNTRYFIQDKWAIILLIGSHKPTPVHNILYDFITDDDINDVDDDVGGMVGICVITGVLIPGLSMGINTGMEAY